MVSPCRPYRGAQIGLVPCHRHRSLVRMERARVKPSPGASGRSRSGMTGPRRNEMAFVVTRCSPRSEGERRNPQGPPTRTPPRAPRVTGERQRRSRVVRTGCDPQRSLVRRTLGLAGEPSAQRYFTALVYDVLEDRLVERGHDGRIAPRAPERPSVTRERGRDPERQRRGREREVLGTREKGGDAREAVGPTGRREAVGTRERDRGTPRSGTS